MPRQKGEGITKIAVKGFKSIAEECAIDIRPLTILAGANSSGKSSIMQPLLLLKQTLDAPYDPGPLLIDGPNVQFTEAAQFLSTLPERQRSDCFQIGIETTNNVSQMVRMTLSKRERGFNISKMIVEEKYRHFILYPNKSVKVVRKLDNENLKHYEGLIAKPQRWTMVLKSQDGRSTTYFTNHEHHISNTIHLPGLRGNPERAYKLTSTGPRYPGTFENYVASLIHEWQESKDKRLTTVTAALHTIGLTGQIGTQKVGDVGIEVQVGRLLHEGDDGTDMISIADVGFGVSQVLPVLVAVIVAEPGQLVYLEQPELHLHPRAQVALAQVLADAAKRGVRVVAETHSSLLLLGVQTLVAEGDLSPELVKLHWFSRNEDGVTEVSSVDLDEAGAYGDWPMDFDDVELKTQGRYIKAAQSRFIERT